MDTQPASEFAILLPIQEYCNGEVVKIHDKLKPMKDLSWAYKTNKAPKEIEEGRRFFCDASGKAIGGCSWKTTRASRFAAPLPCREVTF